MRNVGGLRTFNPKLKDSAGGEVNKEGKLAGPTQILPVNVRGPALILKTACKR